MPLRCLLFSSNEEMVQPIWQVLADLGIEGEYCQSAVDAVERVTTQLFQIVITDWSDQPEAAFLLKTARDLKAAHRPLTLAIVSDDARMPQALQAGANSVLVKPLRAEQVRDTMSTACELLRSKLQPGAPVTPREAPGKAVKAAAAAAGTTSAPASVSKTPENAFRAGEFLQSSSPAAGGHFDTECEVQKSLDQAAAAEIDALTDLEPMAAAVAEAAEQPAEPQTALTGWASLQARLTKSAPNPVNDAPTKGELLSYGETPSYGASSTEEARDPVKRLRKESHRESEPEAALFAYMSEKPKAHSEPAEEPRPKRGKYMLVGALVIACATVLAEAPGGRQYLRTFYRSAVHAGASWLNPPPAPVPPTVAQHESFGQAGDEYKLPVAGNIPDATTDPSQIRVLPVIDPTAKPPKGSEANSGQAQATPVENNPSEQSQVVQDQTGQGQSGDNQVKDATSTSAGESGSPAGNPSGEVRPAVQLQPNAPRVAAQPPQAGPVASPVHGSAPPHAVSAASNAGIPSSLRSQIASMTPESSGAKPVDAAMSSIEPVSLPESIAWGLLAQPVDPVYPEAAKASGQRGSVVLQVLIGRDGMVQDAKFLQGSLVFARSAIDAVKQWRFKPYSLNGRAVSVQSVITLNFKPPA
jgi:TonB family protein